MLTKRQKQVLDYIKQYSNNHDYAPSLDEIKKRFRLASVSTAHFHVKRLQALGFLTKQNNKPRSIGVLEDDKTTPIPILGRIAAGEPIEAIEDRQTINVPRSIVPTKGEIFALKVVGKSMIDENINDGDIVIVKNQETARNGQKVVALIDSSEATLKTYYREKSYIRLQPANQGMKPLIIKKNRNIAIQGIVIDVIREKEKPSFDLEVDAKRETIKHSKLPVNQILTGDVIEEMKKIPDNSIDMTFADPPFNLNKKYGNYKDKKAEIDYIEWCEAWLNEMVRITKPSGSILVHNIPKWLTYYAAHLNKIAHFKHWIAWDALGSPLGKTLLPAHYGILFYTKIIKGFKFNELRAPHKRCRVCGEMIKDYGGKKSQINPYGTLLSDIWTDIHRIRHGSRRDDHPCQLPEPLLERLVLMTTDEGDIILDPFIGAGTTALAAKRLGRKFIGIDIDPVYKKIVAEKLEKVRYRESNGYLYNDSSVNSTSKYLKNLTISEKEGILPIDSHEHNFKRSKAAAKVSSLTLL